MRFAGTGDPQREIDFLDKVETHVMTFQLIVTPIYSAHSQSSFRIKPNFGLDVIERNGKTLKNVLNYFLSQLEWETKWWRKFEIVSRIGNSRLKSVTKLTNQENFERVYEDLRPKYQLYIKRLEFDSLPHLIKLAEVEDKTCKLFVSLNMCKKKHTSYYI